MAWGALSTSLLPTLSPLRSGSQDSSEIATCTWQEETGAMQTGGLSLAWGHWHLGIPSIFQSNRAGSSPQTDPLNRPLGLYTCCVPSRALISSPVSLLCLNPVHTGGLLSLHLPQGASFDSSSSQQELLPLSPLSSQNRTKFYRTSHHILVLFF